MTWRCQATILRWVDGDTAVADLDLGWGQWRRETKGAPCRLRVLGIDTPERDEPEAWAAARVKMESLVPVLSVVWIESHALDSFGRALVTVTLADGTPLLPLLPDEWKT